MFKPSSKLQFNFIQSTWKHCGCVGVSRRYSSVISLIVRCVTLCCKIRLQPCHCSMLLRTLSLSRHITCLTALTTRKPPALNSVELSPHVRIPLNNKRMRITKICLFQNQNVTWPSQRTRVTSASRFSEIPLLKTMDSAGCPVEDEKFTGLPLNAFSSRIYLNISTILLFHVDCL